ncbi:MAG: hypothetical protein KAS90_03185 [Candidatus Aenigmarchaeota archaeon]|nr:hypothetical protein [Candidatus Aenigmarchaeota archaeon]
MKRNILLTQILLLLLLLLIATIILISICIDKNIGNFDSGSEDEYKNNLDNIQSSKEEIDPTVSGSGFDIVSSEHPESKDENYCNFNDYNIYVYINRLHNFFHTEPTDEEILTFIEQDECVYNGSIITDHSTFTILSTWKSNDETILFEHTIGEEIL